jgi:hypothetical protein
MEIYLHSPNVPPWGAVQFKVKHMERDRSTISDV